MRTCPVGSQHARHMRCTRYALSRPSVKRASYRRAQNERGEERAQRGSCLRVAGDFAREKTSGHGACHAPAFVRTQSRGVSQLYSLQLNVSATDKLFHFPLQYVNNSNKDCELDHQTTAESGGNRGTLSGENKKWSLIYGLLDIQRKSY